MPSRSRCIGIYKVACYSSSLLLLLIILLSKFVCFLPYVSVFTHMDTACLRNQSQPVPELSTVVRSRAAAACRAWQPTDEHAHQLAEWRIQSQNGAMPNISDQGLSLVPPMHKRLDSWITAGTFQLLERVRVCPFTIPYQRPSHRCHGQPCL